MTFRRYHISFSFIIKCILWWAYYLQTIVCIWDLSLYYISLILLLLMHKFTYLLDIIHSWNFKPQTLHRFFIVDHPASVISPFYLTVSIVYLNFEALLSCCHYDALFIWIWNKYTTLCHQRSELGGMTTCIQYIVIWVSFFGSSEKLELWLTWKIFESFGGSWFFIYRLWSCIQSVTFWSMKRSGKQFGTYEWDLAKFCFNISYYFTIKWIIYITANKQFKAGYSCKMYYAGGRIFLLLLCLWM